MIRVSQSLMKVLLRKYWWCGRLFVALVKLNLTLIATFLFNALVEMPQVLGLETTT